MLTVISTILGLIPFLTDGPQEVFWFDFAIGTIGGMVFSVIAVILVLPVFVLSKKTNKCIVILSLTLKRLRRSSSDRRELRNL